MIMMSQKRIITLLQQFIEDLGTVETDNGPDRAVGLPESAAQFLFYCLYSKPNSQAYKVAKELATLGNPLIDFDRALNLARHSPDMLLKLRQWIEDGLQKKFDVAFGELPE